MVERDGKVLVVRGREGHEPARLPSVEELHAAGLTGEAVEELAQDCDAETTYDRVLLAGAGAEPDADAVMWASPLDLRRMGLLPEGLTELVQEWLWPFGVREAETPVDWGVVERLWQLYSHDLSEFRGMTPGPDGLLKRGHLASYAPEDRDVVAYLAEQGNRPVGFALVRGLEDDARVMGEFFVVRSVRRRGLAREFAEAVLRRHPGRWWIAFQDENEAAARFWRRLGAEVLEGTEEEGREIPGKPFIPPDRWLSGAVAG